MKRLLLILFLFPYVCFAQDSIRFRDLTFVEGLKAAGAEGKPLFFMGYAAWCEHCRKMKEHVLKNPDVADFYNKNFVCLWQDMEKGEGVQLRRRFQVKSFPTFVYLDAAGNTLYQFTGERSDSAMIEQGKAALTPEKQFPFLKKRFEDDPANAEKCFDYIIALRTAMLDCSEPARKHLATQTDEQLLSAMNWKIIANGIQDINSREIQFVLKHQKEYAQLASPGRVERKIVNLADELLTSYVNAKDTANYFKNRPLAQSLNHPKVDSLIFKLDLGILQLVTDWDKYKASALQYAESQSWNNASLLKEISNNFLVHVADTAALLQAAKWATRAADLNQEYSTHVLAAKLFKKAGNKTAAADMAQKGKDIAAKFGFDHREADMLLEALKK